MLTIFVNRSLPKFFDAANTSMPRMHPFLSRSIMTFSASSSLMSYLPFLMRMYIASAFLSYSTCTISVQVLLFSTL